MQFYVWICRHEVLMDCNVRWCGSTDAVEMTYRCSTYVTPLLWQLYSWGVHLRFLGGLIEPPHSLRSTLCAERPHLPLPLRFYTASKLHCLVTECMNKLPEVVTLRCCYRESDVTPPPRHPSLLSWTWHIRRVRTLAFKRNWMRSQFICSPSTCRSCYTLSVGMQASGLRTGSARGGRVPRIWLG